MLLAVVHQFVVAVLICIGNGALWKVLPPSSDCAQRVFTSEFAVPRRRTPPPTLIVQNGLEAVVVSWLS
jgi:hypothetical protein